MGSTLVLQPVVGKQVVLPEVAHVVAHVIDARVREVAKDVAVVEPRHGHFRQDHLLEGGVGGEDTLTISAADPSEAKARASGEVAALHDAPRNKALGRRFFDRSEAYGALEIAVDDEHLGLALSRSHGLFL